MVLPWPCLVFVFVVRVQEALSFEFPKILTNFGKISLLSKKPEASLAPKVGQTQQALIQAVSGTNNGKSATPEQQTKVLELVRKLEIIAPAPSDILTNPEQAKKIDGVWYLQYTSPSNVGDADQFPDAWKPVNVEEGKSQIDSRPFGQGSGAVSAAGITVPTSNRVVQQIFDVSRSRVKNEIDLGWGRVEVEGSFRASDTVPYRAIVGFDRADIFWGIDNRGGPTIQLGWVFTIVLPLFKNGSKDNGWIETTYISDKMRIARGNKGTLFVLTRDADAVTP